MIVFLQIHDEVIAGNMLNRKQLSNRNALVDNVIHELESSESASRSRAEEPKDAVPSLVPNWWVHSRVARRRVAVCWLP